MLISVLNIKLTCEWHKAIKLNYKNTRTHVIVVLSVPSAIHDTWMPSTDVTWLTAHSGISLLHNCTKIHMQFRASVSWIAVIWHHTQGRTSIRLSADRYSAWIRQKTTLSLAIISVTVQLWTSVFWVISVYFNVRNTLPKSGTFLLGHPVYIRGSFWFTVFD
jgi:hypothetical protein